MTGKASERRHLLKRGSKKAQQAVDHGKLNLSHAAKLVDPPSPIFSQIFAIGRHRISNRCDEERPGGRGKILISPRGPVGVGNRMRSPPDSTPSIRSLTSPRVTRVVGWRGKANDMPRSTVDSLMQIGWTALTLLVIWFCCKTPRSKYGKHIFIGFLVLVAARLFYCLLFR